MPPTRPADLPAGRPGTSSPGLVLEPFRALRYRVADPHDLGLVTSPPYDVISGNGVERLRASHEHNVVRLILPKPDEDPLDTLTGWRARGVLAADDTPALYVYEYATPNGRVIGMVGALRLRAYEDRVVLPHEHVMARPVSERAALMERTRANLEPILLVYDGDGPASDVVDSVSETAPLFTTTAPDGSDNRVWRIDDPGTLRRVAADLRARQALIADGHHRYAAYLRCRRQHDRDGTLDPTGWDCGLAMLVDQTRHPLRLGAVHRVVPDRTFVDVTATGNGSFDDHAEDEAAARASWTAAAAAGRHAMLVTDGRRWGVLGLGEAGVDTLVLHEQLFPRWRVDEDAVRYVHDPGRAVALASETGGVALLLHPPRVSDVLNASAAGAMLPRKSTSFGPKPRMGLLMRSLDD